MDHLDPHLEILLHEFVRLCPEDAALEQDNWTGLYEICLFVHELEVMPPAWTIRDYLVTHGCSLRKATFVSHQYGHFLHLLKLRDQRKTAPPKGAEEA